jgi:hypothetical protein
MSQSLGLPCGALTIFDQSGGFVLFFSILKLLLRCDRTGSPDILRREVPTKYFMRTPMIGFSMGRLSFIYGPFVTALVNLTCR